MELSIKTLQKDTEPLRNVLDVLSKPDALRIFVGAKDGVVSMLNTPQDLGLTKKQYYTRLKQMVGLGLLQKIGDSYVHTTLGSIVYERHVLKLAEELEKIRMHEMTDVLRNKSKFSKEEIESFVSKS